jgi:hypothetical protein
VAVLGDEAVGVELDHAQGDPLTVDRAAEHAVPDLLRSHPGDVVEGAQAIDRTAARGRRAAAERKR